MPQLLGDLKSAWDYIQVMNASSSSCTVCVFVLPSPRQWLHVTVVMVV